MTSKKRKKKRARSPSIILSKTSRNARRLLITLFATGVMGLQVTSCGTQPSVTPQAPGRAPSSTATGFAACPQFFVSGLPPVPPNAPKLRELCFSEFAVLHSGHTRTPVYVAQRLNRQVLLSGNGIKRTDKFFADARLPISERAELGDYKGSGWARGHMAPAGDMATPEGMAQSFSLSNIVPQDAKQNSGPWAKIEDDTRKYVMRARGDVYVITGPVFKPGARTVGSGEVAVPAHLFKLVYDASTGKSWAHWQQNAPEATVGRPISYGELVQRVGMELLPVHR